MMRDLCVECGVRPPRPLPYPIPEGMVVMRSEGLVGYAVYCQECFDADGLSGDCEVDCQDACAYPGEFSECELGQETTE